MASSATVTAASVGGGVDNNVMIETHAAFVRGDAWMGRGGDDEGRLNRQGRRVDVVFVTPLLPTCITPVSWGLGRGRHAPFLVNSSVLGMSLGCPAYVTSVALHSVHTIPSLLSSSAASA